MAATTAYHALVSKYARGSKLDMAALRGVATEPRAVRAGRNILDALSIGFVLHGADDIHEVRAVKVGGAKSTLTECWIGKSYGVNNKFSPHVTTKALPPAIARFNLTQSAGKWRVSSFTSGPTTCAAKG